MNDPEFRQMALDNYDIPIYFDHCNILINPYKAPSTIRAILGNLVAVVPKDGLIKSLEDMSYEDYEQIKKEIIYVIQKANLIRSKKKKQQKKRKKKKMKII